MSSIRSSLETRSIVGATFCILEEEFIVLVLRM